MATVISFLFFFVVFAVVGTLSIRKRRHGEVADYLLASRDVGPWLTALSSVVTNNSGYMFVGLIGFTYARGLPALWLTLGWITGDLLAWFFVHPRLRRQSEHSSEHTVPGLIAEHTRGSYRLLAAVLGVVSILFLATYAAAQLNAGGKALYAVFGWDFRVGAYVGAGLVLLYSYAGGIRASIWTDAAQSVVMFAAMMALAVLCMIELGGLTGLLQELRAIDPALVNIIPEDLMFGFTLYALGWVAAGFGAVGQPHILIRTMALRGSELIRKARYVYFTWYIPFSAAAVLVALSARVLMPDLGSLDPELALPAMAQRFLPGVLVGLVLAGLFAATISTADSQLLTCSAAITRDIFPGLGQSYRMVKVGTAAMTGLVLLVVTFAPTGVFELVIISWSALAASMGPLVLIRIYGLPVDTPVALSMIAGGIAVVAVWNLWMGWSLQLYEILPGMAVGGLIYAGWWLAGRHRGARREGAPMAARNPGPSDGRP